MAKDVKIPVSVTGADKAREELSKTGETVKDLGGAGEASSKGVKQANDSLEAHGRAHQRIEPQVKNSTKQVKLFDDAAKTFVTGVLGRIDPALAGMANVAIDAAKGIGKIGPALIGVAAAGAGLAAISMLINKIRTDAIEAEKAVRTLFDHAAEQRREGLHLEERVAESLQGAGVYGGGMRGAETAAELMKGGIKPEYAEFGAVAEQVGGLSKDQVRQVIAGWLSTGRKGQFGLDQNANKILVRKLLAAGGTEEAKRAIEGAVQDYGQSSREQAPTNWAFDRRYDSREELLAVIAKERGLNAEDVSRIRRALEVTGVPRWRRTAETFKDFRPLSGAPQIEAEFAEKEVPEGGTKTGKQLIDIAEMIEKTALKPAQSSPFTINVRNTTINQDKVINASGIFNRQEDPVGLEQGFQAMTKRPGDNVTRSRTLNPEP